MTYRLGAALATDHRLQVPLDHRDPARGTTTVFARELRDAETADADRPYLLFLQGGPGGSSPRPDGGPAWIDWALERYRVVLLDQRGTGRSDPLDPRVITALGPPERQAEHLALFRADSIVQDCELLRRELIGDSRWTTLGQSFGGFCTFTYLSFAPEALTECLVTGGVAPIDVDIDDVYRSTYARVLARTADLDADFPHVRTILREVADHVGRVEERLPDGEVLTVGRLQEAGQVLGTENGPLRLHYLAESAWAGDRLSEEFLHDLHAMISISSVAPLYALVHEACYGDAGQSTRWSAERVRAELPVIDQTDGPLGLTGEAVYRHTVARQPALAPLTEAMEILAERVWERPLYDREVLSRNEIPIAAQVYARDMYVTHDLSLATAATVRNLQVVVDPERHHDALRKHGPAVLDGLVAALHGDGA